MSREIPEIVKALEDRIEDWDYTAGGILIHPKETLVKEIVVRYIPVSIGFEHKTQFLSPTVIVSEGDMGIAHYSKYRALKSLECEIRWSGFARKKAKFTTYQELLDLRSYITDLNLGNELIDALNSNSELMSLISGLRPDDLTITLDSISSSDMPYIQSREDLLKYKAKFFLEPTRIIWLTKMSMMLIRRPGYQKRAKDLLRILNLISCEVIRVSGQSL